MKPAKLVSFNYRQTVCHPQVLAWGRGSARHKIYWELEFLVGATLDKASVSITVREKVGIDTDVPNRL